jgi:hypothetical protein
MIPVGICVQLPLPFPFLTGLEYSSFLRKSDNEILIRLLEDLEVDTRVGRLLIPAGFESDGASIPKVARALVGSPFEFEYLAAAIVHDALYRKGMFDQVSRAEADLVFRDLMWNTKVAKWKVPLFYAAVRAGGWRFFKKFAYQD